MKNCIAQTRKSLKIRQDKLAQLVGIGRPHLSKIENDKAEPGGYVMIKIAEVLGKRVEDIFFAPNVRLTQQKIRKGDERNESTSKDFQL